MSPRDFSATVSEEALFRYQLVSDVLARMMRGTSRREAVAAVAEIPHPTFAGHPRRTSPRTLYRWLSAYEKGGITGLEPASRGASEASSVLPQEFLDFLTQQKTLDPKASLPEIIRRAREKGILQPSDSVHRTTVYREAKRREIPLGRRKKSPHRDARRFAYPHRMDMVLCDGKHFRAGVTRQKRVALFFLDDATRMGLGVAVGTSETARLFLRGFYELLLRHGLMSILYLDHGPGFIAADTLEVLSHLGVLLVHGESAYPEGHGKVEKFNQTALHGVLRGLDGRADVDSACGALEVRLAHYLRSLYNHNPHESLGQKTPHQRFHEDTKPLSFPESQEKLRAQFLVHFTRHVSVDNIVSVDSVLYETPTGYADTRVRISRRVLTGELLLLHQGRLIQLHPVDLAQNARARRGASSDSDADTKPVLPKSAADLAFERDFGPVVGPDGGFSDPNEERTDS